LEGLMGGIFPFFNKLIHNLAPLVGLTCDVTDGATDDGANNHAWHTGLSTDTSTRNCTFNCSFGTTFNSELETAVMHRSDTDGSNLLA
ncbi:MAG: hypothetical protein ACRC9V_03835, partial [Aeromonas sp.]